MLKSLTKFGTSIVTVAAVIVLPIPMLFALTAKLPTKVKGERLPKRPFVVKAKFSTFEEINFNLAWYI